MELQTFTIQPTHMELQTFTIQPSHMPLVWNTRISIYFFYKSAYSYEVTNFYNSIDSYKVSLEHNNKYIFQLRRGYA